MSRFLAPIDYEQLDPGIRVLVAWLREHGFETTDSGDGKTKPEDQRTIEGPHVFMVAGGSALACRHANRLYGLLQAAGVKLEPGQLQALYDPVDGVAIVGLYGVDDAVLAAAVPQ